MAIPVPLTQHAFGQTPVHVDLSGGKGSISIPDLLKVANEILTRAKRSGLEPDNPADIPEFDTLYKDLWERFKEFAKEFPIIFRWIVHHFEFNEKAFRAYLRESHKGMWKDKKEMYRAQADYLVFLRRQNNRDEKTRELESYRKFIQKHLDDEHEKFEAAAAEAEVIQKKNAADRTLRIRERLMEIAQRTR
jgi:hypothetical protein